MVDEESHSFDSHSPVLVQFRMPHRPPAISNWRLPVSWADFKPPADLVEQHYTAQPAGCLESPGDPAHTLDELFLAWAKRWEVAVHRALQQSHAENSQSQPQPGLPRRCRGRCRLQTKRCILPAVVAKFGRQGDYQPSQDPTTVICRQCTRS